MVGTIPLLVTLILAFSSDRADWGFFGHKLANRHAVFTLPSDLIGFYKTNIQFIEQHAVDADKRRYASPHEAVRHYIDLDRKGGVPVDTLERSWTGALAQHMSLYCVDSDSTLIDLRYIPFEDQQRFVRHVILPVYYDDNRIIEPDSVEGILGIEVDTCLDIFYLDKLSNHGILPWNLIAIQRRLTGAFVNQDIGAILRLSADIGHYIGDAHVPLHTSENYDGQLTGQDGIHAFWESRVPELFADEYDFFVGRAQYISDPAAYFWSVVISSHRLVDSVLMVEKQLTDEFGKEGKYCYDERGSTIVRTYCKEFAREFDHTMSGMVERQMRKTIHAIGSSWYTAWVDAGRPDLPGTGYIGGEKEQRRLDTLEAAYSKSVIKGRLHSDHGNE